MQPCRDLLVVGVAVRLGCCHIGLCLDMYALHKHGTLCQQECMIGIRQATQYFDAFIHAGAGLLTDTDIFCRCFLMLWVEVWGFHLQTVDPLLIEADHLCQRGQFFFLRRVVQIGEIFHRELFAANLIVRRKGKVDGWHLGDREELTP